MKNFIRANKLLLVVILVSIIASGSVIGTRTSIESANKTYDIVLDYTEMERMASQSDYDISWWLTDFKKQGINKVGLQEENIMTLMEDSRLPVEGQVMGNVMEQAFWKDSLPVGFISSVEEKGTFDDFDVLVKTGDAEATSFVTDGIQKRFQEERYAVYRDGEKAWIWLDGTADTTLYSEKHKYMDSSNAGFIERIGIEGSKLMYISLGLPEDKVKIIADAGMNVIPRTLAYNGWNDTKYAEAVIDEYERYGITPKYVIAGGEATIGYDDGTDFVKDYIIDNDLTIGLIENTTQLQNIMQYGVNEVATESKYDTVRVFSVWNYIQNRYQYYGYEGAKEIENTLFRAITERNIRVIYFKPFMEIKDLHTYITDPEDYRETFSNLADRLSEHGFEQGDASVMKDYSVPTAIRVLIAIGVAMGAVLLLRSILPINNKLMYIIAALGAACALGAYVVIPNMAILITAFAAAVVFSCIAVTAFAFMSRESAESLDSSAPLTRIIKYASAALIGAAAIAFIGGIVTAATISSTSFMLEIDIFRGVKISQLLPIAYFVIVFLAYYGFGEKKAKIGRLEIIDIKDMLNMSIKVWMVIVLGILGIVGVYYILRTGHDSSLQVLSFEMLFRNKLEELLLARPRTKEFLFAFPAIMLMVYCSVRRFKLLTFVMGLFGVIGMTSITNTFMHIRTPLYLGFIRTGYSLLFGLILGIIAIVAFEIIYKIYCKHFKKYIDAVD
ncbi:MAG: DUF5693 family protein [Eubacteriales bacterium]|nr:DUF5693 family protein [Eubacteriales bacterium]MDD4390037.1 DUF5693 family protein [Eubacteriales bacterium]